MPIPTDAPVDKPDSVLAEDKEDGWPGETAVGVVEVAEANSLQSLRHAIVQGWD